MKEKEEKEEVITFPNILKVRKLRSFLRDARNLRSKINSKGELPHVASPLLKGGKNTKNIHKQSLYNQQKQQTQANSNTYCS